MGYLSVDGGEVVPGKSQGEFRALDLSGILYVGGVPAGQDIFLPADLQSLAPDSGFYGTALQRSQRSRRILTVAHRKYR